MKKKKLLLITMLVASSVAMAGCTSGKTDGGKTIETLKVTEVESKELEDYKFKTLDFNLGEKKLTGEGIKESPYYLRGILSVPSNKTSEKLKPVILIHGCHDNDNVKRYDTGFKYLTEYLAKKGFLAISVDVNAAYDWKYGDNAEYEKVPMIVDEHIKTLKSANSGEKVFDVDLKDKIDFDNIALMGHSTAGEVIFKIAEQQKKKGTNINTLLAVAPTNNTDDSNYNQDVKNISIVVPELDGDVIGLSGLGIYNDLKDLDKQEILSATFLKNANHNYFNSEVERNDSESTDADLSKQLTREKQEDFLKEYTVNYLNAAFDKNLDGTSYDNKTSTTTKLLGQDVLTYLKTNKGKKILEINKLDKITTNEGTESKVVVESQNVNYDTADGVNFPQIKKEKLELLNIKWKNKDSKLSFNPLVSDFSAASNINMNVLLDGMDELNPKGESQGLTVELVDKNGKSQQVEITKESNLINYPLGKIDQLDLGHKIHRFWDKTTTLSNIRIPLTLFKSIDLKEIKEVNIIFNKTESGSLIFESFNID